MAKSRPASVWCIWDLQVANFINFQEVEHIVKQANELSAGRNLGMNEVDVDEVENTVFCLWIFG